MLRSRWAAAFSRSWQPYRAHISTTSTASTLSPALLSRARALAAEHARLAEKLQEEYNIKIAKKAGSLTSIVSALNGWEAANDSLPELRQLIKDRSTDEELRSLAAEELESTQEKLVVLAKELQTSLIPKHPFTELPCLLELRPGAGGDEAALFAGDLLRMYQAFCKNRGLRSSILKLETEAATSSDEKIQEAVLEIDTPGAYDILRCEAGVHRVQRVPATETKGRTHTSAVSVLVLPSFPSEGAEDDSESNFDDPASDYFVDVKDVKIETMRARGAGGQHVNMTDSAVRMTHIPTNTIVAMQDQRSQQKNRQKAWQILRSKLAQARREAREEEMANIRVSTIGIAKMGRGDKIRTYNWSQQRVTDHRCGITVHNLDNVLEGGENLEKVMSNVKDWLKANELQALIAEEEAAANSVKKNND